MRKELQYERERERERERETIFQRDCWGNKYIALVHQL